VWVLPLTRQRGVAYDRRSLLKAAAVSTGRRMLLKSHNGIESSPFAVIQVGLRIASNLRFAVFRAACG
jgi:hypothetical protein